MLFLTKWCRWRVIFLRKVLMCVGDNQKYCYICTIIDNDYNL